MKKFIYLFLITGFISLQSCIFFKNCIKPEGEVVKHYLELSEIHSIELSSSVKVILSQSDQQKIEVVAPPNYFEVLNKEVKGGEWEINFDRCLKEGDIVEIYMSLKEIKELEINGSGKLIGEGLIEGKKLDVEINGSGSLSMEVDYKDLEVEIQGSGETTLKGKTKKLEIEINGSGDVDAENLISDDSKVQINGSGDVKVHSEGSLEIQVNGSGDVFYKGEPKSIDSKINGSGTVAPM